MSTPFMPLTGKQSCTEDCDTLGMDGLVDLWLAFDNQEVVTALGAADGDCVVVTVTGELQSGTPITGEDVIRMQCK